MLYPEGHIHFTVHGYGGRNSFFRLLALVNSSVKAAEGKVGMGHNRPHTNLVGKEQSPSKMVLGPGHIWGITARTDFTGNV